MFRLVDSLNNQMGESFTELNRAKLLIETTLKDEEIKFRETLERGLGLLDQSIKKLNNTEALPGSIAFKLYDTYGFPLDLTQDILKNKSLGVDNLRFDQLMKQSKELAKKNWKGSGDSAVDDIWFGIKDKLGPTEFLGYETNQAEDGIRDLVRSRGLGDVYKRQ